MDELGIECQVGHPASVRAAEPRKQKHDRRDADLILKLMLENRFPSIWLPSKELLDLRALVAAPPSVGANANTSAERAPGHCVGKRAAARPVAVEPSRTRPASIFAIGATHGASAE